MKFAVFSLASTNYNNSNLIRLMNHPKNYTKLILDRLNKKIEQSAGKDALSNLKTQSTLHDTSQTAPHSHTHAPLHQVRSFFDSFEINAVAFHEPVIVAHRKPLRRSLFYELSDL